MTLTSGRYRFGSDTGAVQVRTTRQGLASAAGHDLLIEVTRWEGSATVDVATPENSEVEATFDARSFEVRAGTGGVKPLTAHDCTEIKATLERKVLDAHRYPEIRFVSRAVTADAPDIRLDGELTIRGITRPITVAARSVLDERVRFTGDATVVQTAWKITPYKGLFGALKVADPVIVSFDFTFA
jgi:polyisoprenoid-binding protein YceI